MNQASASAAGRAQPGALMHQASDGMGASNFQVHPPEPGRQVMPEALSDNAAAGRPAAAVCVVAEISVTNPGCPGRGRVLVSDEGALLWECDDEDTAGLAAVIAGILAADIAQGCLQRAAPAPARSAAGTR